MSDEILKELEGLKQTLSALSGRIRQLEQRVGSHPPAPAPHTAARPTPVPAKPREPVALPTKRADAETLETKIGRYWLNRIGITSLVLGVAFFILYTFQYFGPGMKIATGFAVAAGLIGLGVVLERRAGWQWYARGLIGGGWALCYFTTYAMHHVPEVRIVQSAWLDLYFLLAVVIGAVWHSLKYRSEVITALALLLGFVTTSISAITSFTLASSALLIGGLSWLVVRMRWAGLYLYGVVASYVTYLFWINPEIKVDLTVALGTMSVEATQMWLSIGFVVLYWVAYNAVLVILGEPSREKSRGVLTATLINGLGFVYAVLTAMDPVHGYHDWRYLVLFGIGAAYSLSSPLLRRRGFTTVSTAHLLMGLSFMTLAIPLKLTERWTSFLWLVEVAGFAWLGLRTARWSYRAFAFGLAVVAFGRLFFLDLWNTQSIAVLNWAIPWRLVIGYVGIAAFALAATVYRLPRFRAILRPIESQAFHLYCAAALAVAWVLTMLEADSRWVSVFWALEASGVIGLGLWLSDRGLRMMGAAATGFTALLVLGEMGRWELEVTSWIAALWYGLGWLYRSVALGERFAIEQRFHHVYTIAASVLLTLLLWLEVNRQWLSLAWAVEGLALVGIGFWLGDKVFRVSGLVVFGLLVLKILFVDLAGAETIYRILSFIVAGAILLLASFGYARFTTKRAHAQKGSTDPP